MFVERLLNKAKQAVDQYCFEYSLYRLLPVVYERSPRWSRPHPLEYVERLTSVYECSYECHPSTSGHYSSKSRRLFDMFDHEKPDSERITLEFDEDMVHDLMDLMSRGNMDAGQAVSSALKTYKLIVGVQQQGRKAVVVSPLGAIRELPKV